MATMEKKKQRKKEKKTVLKNQDKVEELSEDVVPELSFVDIDFPSTSVSEENQEAVSVTDEIKNIELEPDDVEEVEDVEENNLTDAEKIISESVPSAPIIEDIPTDLISLPKISYPSLSEMKNIESITATKQFINFKLIPFTKNQLLEYYSNKELQMASEFEDEFVNKEINENDKCTNHVLYHILMIYMKGRQQLKTNLLEMDILKRKCKENYANMWTIEDKTFTGSGKCADGRTLKASHKSTIALFQEATFGELDQNLKALMQLTCFVCTKLSYEVEGIKIQIDQKLREVLDVFHEIKQDSPVVLKQSVDQNLLSPIGELRLCTSILFSFLRKPSPDKQFTSDVKKWIKMLISNQLRIATWQDHLFILFHILRCPSGVATWAASFIQTPLVKNVISFSSDEFQHCVAVLACLLLPIKKRNEFLEKLHIDLTRSIDAVQEEMWTLVDSDGEDSCSSENGQIFALKESDLVALIDQIPFQNIFKAMTLAENDQIHVSAITSFHVLKNIAFASTFVELLGNGLMTYDTERYKQFAKRLGRLIKHTVFYVTDLKRIVMKRETNDVNMMHRVNIEYDTFVIRASQYIYKSRKLGIWQYLTGFPYSSLSLGALWRLYYCLHLDDFQDDVIEDVKDDFKQKCTTEEGLIKFKTSLIEIPAEDLYYLLQSFATMIMNREKMEWDFIETVALNLFRTGFINKTTKDVCYKAVKDLLYNIVLKYPEIISKFIIILKSESPSLDSSSIYLFRSILLTTWRPTWEDFETLASWILNCSFDSTESTIARAILSRLNWNFDQNDQLFLPYDIHVRMACLITEVCAKHVPENIGGSSESISNLVKNKVLKDQFLLWCWGMASSLRLHCMDQNTETVHNTIKNPSFVLRYVLELERTEQIYQGVTESRPLAIYFSILISLWGHSVPQICHKGLDQVKLLLTDGRYSIVIRCLQLITPLFMECPDSLSKCDKFKTILTTLLASNRTYYKTAKEQIYTDSSEPVTMLLGNMITSQLINYLKYGLKSPTMLINVWVLSLTELPNWTKDNSILYLLDIIFGIAYQFPDSWHSIKDYFRQYYSKFDDIKVSKSSGLLSLLGASSSHGDIFTNPTAATIYVSVICLELEYELLEIQTRVWMEILRLLNGVNGKMSIDAAIKKATGLLGYSSFAPQNLVIYKLANLITTCSIKDNLFPIICQQFFTLFLSRIPFSTEEDRFYTVFGVADKLYEGNISLMKKVKKQLMDAESYHKENSIDDGDDAKMMLHNNTLKLFKTFQLWLEDTLLNTMKAQGLTLPPQYDCVRLSAVFAGNRNHWTEFINLKEIRQKQRNTSDSWLKICYRYQHPPATTTSSSLSHTLNTSVSTNDFMLNNPQENILNRLKSYDAALPAPEVFKGAPIMKQIDFLYRPQQTLSQFKNNFRTLETYARKEFHMMYNEHLSLDCNLKEMIKKLYQNDNNFIHKTLSCGTLINECTGSVQIAVEYQMSKLNKSVKTKMESNRSEHSELMLKESKISDSIIMASVQIEFFLRNLVNAYEIQKTLKNEDDCGKLKRFGVNLFYDTIDKMNDYNKICPITKDICSFSISKLGFFIQECQNDEGINLLNIALRRADLTSMITELLIPSASPPEYFIAMYKFIVDSHIKRCDTQVLFVLLSKFDILNWLLRFKPKLIDINQLANLIVQGLESWNQTNAVLIQDLLRRHLIHLFQHEFPEHYGEILQMVLTSSSNKKIMPVVLLDLVNSMRKMAGCNELTFGMGLVTIRDDFRNFAIKQNVLSYKVIVDTTTLLGHHFQSERLLHGLHGLYPKQSDYCEAISLLLGSIGHCAIVSGVHAYPGVLADELVKWLWPSLSNMFSPWLIPYFPQIMKTQPANWIQKMTDNSVLLPWSEIHADTAFRMVVVFENSLQYLLDMLPASNTIFGHIFCWYESHFANISIPRFVLVPIHSNLMKLPWDRFRPFPIHIEGINRILQQFIPESHMFTGHIFIRIAWTPWLYQNMSFWDYNERERILSSLLMIFVKISYEPNAREGMKIVTLLEEATKYPWHLLEYPGIETVLDWFVMSAEPSVVLKMPSEGETVDSAVLDLLQVAAAIKFNAGNVADSHVQVTQIRSKRILYVRSIVRLLISCGSKYQKLLATKEGLQSFHNAVLGLLDTIETVMFKINEARDRELEAKNLMAEIIVSLQVQSEFTSKLFVEAAVMWMHKTKNDNSSMIVSSLDAIGLCETFTFNLCNLVEEALANYCKKSENSSWSIVMAKLGNCSRRFESLRLVEHKHLLCLHVEFVQRIRNTEDIGEKIMLLQKLHKLLEDIKISDQSEAKLILHWGLIIIVGCEIMKISSNSQNQLLTLARHLQVISTHNAGWGDGLLGAIGIKKDPISNRRKVVAKCLSCIIFSAFGDANTSKPSKEFELAMADLKQVITIKRFSDLHVKTKAATNLIENTNMLENINENVCKILRLFYEEDAFLKTTEDVWKL